MQLSGTTEGVIDAVKIKPIVDELRANDDILALIIFGSVARGQARRNSDIDLCIITKKGIPKSRIMELLSYGSQRIDVSLFWDLPLTIRFRVIQEGKAIFCKDLLAFHRIRVRTVREYLDNAPLIRRHSLHAMGNKR